ncbi:MAG: NAD(P)-binding protein [Actinobacteria bacterium]|nr:NAD(P)-binding protein [Actinomycetota bacterium]
MKANGNISKNMAIVLGAGATGLAAAWRLAQKGFDVKVVEKEDYVGGQAFTLKHGDFLLDLGPHKLYSTIDYIMEIIHGLLKDDLLEQEKRSKILINGKYINFPIDPKEMVTVLKPWQATRCIVNFLYTLVTSGCKSKEVHNYEEWVINHFGRVMYEMFVRPTTEKIWGECRTLGVELAETRIRVPDIKEIFKEIVLRKKPERIFNAKTFIYPKYGVGMITDKMREKIIELGGTVSCGLHPVRVETDNGKISRIKYSDGSFDNLEGNDVLVSTIPKADLINIMDSSPDDNTANAVESLKERSIILMYIVINKPSITEDNWIFFPEPKIIFNRLFEQKNFSTFTCPGDRTVICMEITCHFDDPVWRASADDLYIKTVKNLQSAGLIKPEDIIENFQLKLPHAYPILDIYYKGNLKTVMEYFDKYENLYSIGRQGGSIYGGVPDCMDMGFITADFIISKKHHSHWKAEREKFNGYFVVD